MIGAVLPFLFAPVLASAADQLQCSSPRLVLILASFGLTVVAGALFYVPFQRMHRKSLRRRLERVQRLTGEAESPGSSSASDAAWGQAVRLHRWFPVDAANRLVRRTGTPLPLVAPRDRPTSAVGVARR